MSDWGGSNRGGCCKRGAYDDAGCCSCKCACPSTVGIFILAATLGLSFLLLILSGTIGGSWIPMINLIGVFFLPVFAVLSGQLSTATSDYSYSEGKAIWRNFGACFLGTVLCSMVGLPLILLHAGTLTNAAFGYWLGSTGIAVRCVG